MWLTSRQRLRTVSYGNWVQLVARSGEGSASLAMRMGNFVGSCGSSCGCSFSFALAVGFIRTARFPGALHRSAAAVIRVETVRSAGWVMLAVGEYGVVCGLARNA